MSDNDQTDVEHAAENAVDDVQQAAENAVDDVQQAAENEVDAVEDRVVETLAGIRDLLESHLTSVHGKLDTITSKLDSPVTPTEEIVDVSGNDHTGDNNNATSTETTDIGRNDGKRKRRRF